MKFLKEAKSVGTLYHITNIEGMDIILNDNILCTKNQSGISFTRDKNLNRIIGSAPRSWFKVVIDGDLLSERYKIYPKNATNYNGYVPHNCVRVDLSHEHEEYVPSHEIVNINKYIKGVIIILDELTYELTVLSSINLNDDEDLFRHGSRKMYLIKDLKDILNQIKSIYPLYAQLENKIYNNDKLKELGLIK